VKNHRLLFGIAGFALTLALGTPGFAQEAAPAAGTTPEAAPAAAEPAPAEPAKQLDAAGTKTDTKAKSTDQFEADIDSQKSEAAAPAAPKAEDAQAEGEDEDYGHGMQFGLRAGFVGGYRMVFRYDQSPFCHVPDLNKEYKNQQKFCGFGAPFAIDLALSFAPFDAIEPFVWTRLGLSGEAATNTEPVFIFGAGARIYTMSDSAFKIFIEPAVGVEMEKGVANRNYVVVSPSGARIGTGAQETPFEYKTDFVFHLVAGPQFDFAKGVGAYINAGVTLGVLRALHSELEGQIGIQFRFP
jgi:hypothetical protein